MSARAQTTLTGYKGFKKNAEGQWSLVAVSLFKTVTEAREAGATKCRPQFTRSNRKSS